MKKLLLASLIVSLHAFGASSTTTSTSITPSTETPTEGTNQPLTLLERASQFCILNSLDERCHMDTWETLPEELRERLKTPFRITPTLNAPAVYESLGQETLQRFLARMNPRRVFTAEGANRTTERHADNGRMIYINHAGTLRCETSDDGSMRIFDTSNQELIATLTGHDTPVKLVQFSPDGTLMLSISSITGTMHVWNLANGQCISVLQLPGYLIYSARFNDDSNSIDSLVSPNEDDSKEEDMVVTWRRNFQATAARATSATSLPTTVTSTSGTSATTTALPTRR